MRHLCRALLAIAITAPLASAQATHQDSLDARYIKAKLDTLRTANGTGQRRNLSDAAIARVNAWLTRLTGVTPPPPPPPPPLPAPPVANFTVRCDTTGTFVCHFDGSASTGRKVTYAWDCGAFPNCTNTLAIFDFKYPHEGTRTTVLSVTDSAGRSSTSTKTFVVVLGSQPPPPPPPVDTGTAPPPPIIIPPSDTSLGINPPALPRSVPDASPKPCTVHKDVTVPMDLQLALNAAQPGDCLDLAQGQEWKGNFVLPKRSCTASSAWTTIQTKGIADAVGVRMTPAGAATFAKITSTFNQMAITTGHPTCRWQLLHLNIQSDPAFTGLSYHLLVLGDGGWSGAAEVNTSLAMQPTDIIVRRNWIHGQPTTNLVRCVVVNGIRQSIVDNWIENCHANGFDSQAIEGWNGAGPILIENNFASGAGENILFGGADPADSTLNPKDITIRRNHIWKDPLWKGGPWSIKNLFELKNARRVLVEGNVFEHSWVASQVGMAIVIKSSIGGDATKTWQGTQDVTFRNNRIDDAHRGLNLQGVDCSGQMCTDVHTERFISDNNLFTNIGTGNGIPGSDGWHLLLANGLKDVLIRNTTFVTNQPDLGLAMYLAYDQGKWANIRIRNNVFAGQSYYAIGADCPPNVGTAALNCMIGSSWTFSGNIASEVDQQFWATHPAGNVYRERITDLGLTADWRVPLFPAAGVNVTTLNAAIAGVVVRAGPIGVSGRRAIARPRLAPITRADSIFMSHQPKDNAPDIPRPRRVPRPR